MGDNYLINKNDIYKSKYLKYKSKYLDLKNQMEGGKREIEGGVLVNKKNVDWYVFKKKDLDRSQSNLLEYCNQRFERIDEKIEDPSRNQLDYCMMQGGGIYNFTQDDIKFVKQRDEKAHEFYLNKKLNKSIEVETDNMMLTTTPRFNAKYLNLKN